MASTDSNTRSKTIWLGIGFALSLLTGGIVVTSQYYSPFEPEIIPALASTLTAAAPIKDDASPPCGVDIAHVKVGQAYHFAGLRPGVVTVWRVKEITRTEIRYEEGVLKNGRFTSRGTFLFPRRDPKPTPGLSKVGSERLEVSGAGFDCGVYQVKGLKTWSANKFPGTIRTMSGKTVVRALVRIEQS